MSRKRSKLTWRGCALSDLLDFGRDKIIDRERTDDKWGSERITYFTDGSAVKVEIEHTGYCPTCDSTELTCSIGEV